MFSAEVGTFKEVASHLCNMKFEVSFLFPAFPKEARILKPKRACKVGPPRAFKAEEDLKPTCQQAPIQRSLGLEIHVIDY